MNPNPVPEGTFVYDTLSAIVDTNNKTGYTLTMNTEEEETALAQEDGVTKIDSLEDEVTVTSENQSNFTMNRWGYALTDTLTDSETTFNKIPALSAPTTIKTSDAPVSDDTTPVTLATRVDTSLPSGTYKNTLVFTATANYVPRVATGQLIFNANTGNSAPSTLSVDLNEDTPTATLKIPDAIATKSGNYTFGGWALSPDTKDPDYIQGDDVEVTLDNSKITLYAVWLKDTLGAISTMQEMTPEICEGTDTLAVLTTVSQRLNTNIPTHTLRDTRDGNTYEVRRMIDGNCWMGSPLRIVGPLTLTPQDTDITKNFNLPTTSEYDYSFDIATAGSGTNLTSGDAPESICPKGWQLPRRSGNSKSLSNFDTILENLEKLDYWDERNTFKDWTGRSFYSSNAWTSTVLSSQSVWTHYTGSDSYNESSNQKNRVAEINCVAR